MGKSVSNPLSFEINQTSYFAKKLKEFSKKDRDFPDHIITLKEDLRKGIFNGDMVYKNTYKVRIGKQGQGKSGGFRVAYYVVYNPNLVFLLTALNKTDDANFKLNDLKELVDYINSQITRR